MEAKKEEPNEAKLVCYETYAALGAFLFDLAEKGHPQADKLLDNLSEARLVHADVVPFADVASVAPSQAASDEELLKFAIKHYSGAFNEAVMTKFLRKLMNAYGVEGKSNG